MKFETYELHLPYFRTGDDLAYHMRESPTIPEALARHAEQLESAAAILRRLASVAVDTPSMTILADCHYIGVMGPEKELAGLVADEILTIPEDVGCPSSLENLDAYGIGGSEDVPF